MEEQEDARPYKVVVNHEEQYSIWLADREPPAGWREDGTHGSKAECLAHIKEVWTDMRPLSLRRHMAEARPAPPPAPVAAGPTLVERLSIGTHPVEIGLSGEKSARELERRIAAGYVHVRFTGTRGGTELGIAIDRDRTSVGGADFARASGKVKLVGRLVLDYVPVECHAEIDLATLAGTGNLKPIGG